MIRSMARAFLPIAAWRRAQSPRAAVLCLVVVASLATPAQAEVALGEYRRMKLAVEQGDRSSGIGLNLLLNGLMDGIEAVNAAYREKGEKRLICLPQNPRPTARDVLFALEDEFQARRAFWTDERSLAFATMMALQRRYPCK